jgi:hypothetical protein
MVDSIQVQLAAAACDRCPVAALSERTALRDVRFDPTDERIDFVADDLPTDQPSELESLDFAGEAHGRYDLKDEGSSCDASGDDTNQSDAERDAFGSCDCNGLLPGVFNFPVSPHEMRIDDGELIATFVLTGHDELQSIVDALGTVEIRQVLVEGDSCDGRSGVVPVDLSGVTKRQATVAAAAVEKGYFEPNGATADEVAAELGLAKSTVSEHLRLVTATVLSQLFGKGT